jgi:YfiH family protein
MSYDRFPNLAKPSYEIDSHSHILRSPVLDRFLWLTHGVTLRGFAPPETRAFDLMAEVRRRLVPGGDRLFFGEQVHDTRIHTVDPQRRYADSGGARVRGPLVRLANTDALIVGGPHAPVAIQTADCVPVLIVDLLRKRIALAHAGWRGALDRIARKTVEELIGQGSAAADLVAWMGPAIGRDKYEVGPELAARFRAAFPDHDGIVTDDHHLDLILLNAHQLESAGVPAAQIHAANLCTATALDHCYSYRAESDRAGRMATYAMLL